MFSCIKKIIAFHVLTSATYKHWKTLKFRQLSAILRDKLASDQSAILWVKLEKNKCKVKKPIHSLIKDSEMSCFFPSCYYTYVRNQLKAPSNFHTLQWYLGYTVETAAGRNTSMEGLQQLPTSTFSTFLTGGSSTLSTAQLQLLRTRKTSLFVHYLSIMLRIHFMSCFCFVFPQSCCFCPI